MIVIHEHGISTAVPNHATLIKNGAYRIRISRGTQELRVYGANPNQSDLVAVYDVPGLRFSQVNGPPVFSTIIDARYPLDNGECELNFQPLISPFFYGDKRYQEFEIQYLDNTNTVTESCSFNVNSSGMRSIRIDGTD